MATKKELKEEIKELKRVHKIVLNTLYDPCSHTHDFIEDVDEVVVLIEGLKEREEQYSTDWEGLCATLNDAFYDGVSAIKIVDGTDCLAAVGRLIIDKKETDKNLDELDFKNMGLEAIIEEQKHTLNKSHGNNAGLRKKIEKIKKIMEDE